MTKKRAYTARDIEDLTRLTLKDAIDAIPKSELHTQLIEAQEENKRLAVKTFEDMLPEGIEYEEAPTLRFMLEGKIYGKMYQRDYKEGGFNTFGGKMKSGVVIDLDNLMAGANKKHKAIAKAMATRIVEQLELFAKWKASVAKRDELQKKLEDYKDLAARFRLGLTGDESDMDSINHKIRQFLLA